MFATRVSRIVKTSKLGPFLVLRSVHTAVADSKIHTDVTKEMVARSCKNDRDWQDVMTIYEDLLKKREAEISDLNDIVGFQRTFLALGLVGLGVTWGIMIAS